MVIFTHSLNTDTYYFGKWRPLTPTDMRAKEADIFTSVHKVTCYPARRSLPSLWPQSDLKSHASAQCIHRPPLHRQRACQSCECALVFIHLYMMWHQETSRDERRINSATLVVAAHAHVATGQDAEIMSCTPASYSPLGNVWHRLHVWSAGLLLMENLQVDGKKTATFLPHIKLTHYFCHVLMCS